MLRFKQCWSAKKDFSKEKHRTLEQKCRGWSEGIGKTWKQGNQVEILYIPLLILTKAVRTF